MLPSSIASASRAPRRLVDRRTDRTTVTRKSAPARIAELPQPSTEIFPIALDTAVTAATHTRRVPDGPSHVRLKAKTPDRGSLIRKPSFESSESSGEESDASYSSFVLSMKKKDLLRPDDPLNISGPLVRKPSDRTDAPDSNFKYPYNTQPTKYRVLKSRYRGDLFRNSKLSAQLTVESSKQPAKLECMKPLFKWIHVENPKMNFGAYIEYVTRCPYLDDAERDSVSSILRTAREKSERSLRMPRGAAGTYIEPEYFEESIESTVYLGPRSQRTRKEIVRWIAIPYFYLTPSAAQGEGRNYHGLSLPRFGNSGCIDEGDFFQVAQLWCLMIGDGLMISSTRMPMTDMPGNLIDLNYIPPVDPTRHLTKDSFPELQVSDGGLRLWLLPLEECQTWLNFIANFISLGLSLVDGWQVKYRGMILNSTDWDAVVSMAKSAPVRLELCRKNSKDTDKDKSTNDSSLGRDDGLRDLSANLLKSSERVGGSAQSIPSAPSSPIVESYQNNSPNVFDGTTLVRDTLRVLHVDEIHVFTLLATVQVAPRSRPETVEHGAPPEPSKLQDYSINEEQLQSDLDELDHYLSTKNDRQMERVSYVECSTKTIQDVEMSVSDLSRSDQGVYNSKRAFVRAVRAIFEFFFPLLYEHPITIKFWGSIDRIIRSQDSKIINGVMLQNVIQLAEVTSEIRQELSLEKQLSHYMTTVPDEFIQAWMLIQMYFICYTIEDSSRCSDHLRRSRSRLLKGRLKLIERLQRVNIREREAVLPLGLTCLLMAQLLHDSQGPLTPERHRLTSAYWTYFKDFKRSVHENPLSRKYETTFSTLKSQFETIIGQLEDQQRVLVTLQDSVDEAESHSFVQNLSMRTSISSSREASISDYLLHQTAEMLQNFWEMSRRLNELENWHFLCLSIDKDKQDRASLTFTTVTVFFLPLTTLASVLGMNTSDIRNMSDGQWVFWVVAIPLCLFSLSIWLFYLRSFGRYMPWRKHRHGNVGKEALKKWD